MPTIKPFTKKHYQQISRRLNEKINLYNRHEFLCDNFYLGDTWTWNCPVTDELIHQELKSYGLKNFSGGAFGNSAKKANLRRLMLIDFIILSKSKG